MYLLLKNIKIKPVRLAVCALLGGGLLSACNNDQQVSPVTQADTANAGLNTIEKPLISDQGQKLTEVAGQATMPEQGNAKGKGTISAQQRQYVGRYHTQINCEDAFALCEKGTAEFIINLLPDGSAHRTFVYLGKMTGEKTPSRRNFQQDTWHYDAEHHEIVIARVEGIHFYYHVNAQDELQMDLERIQHATEFNQNYYAMGNPLPEQAYVLKKIPGL